MAEKVSVPSYSPPSAYQFQKKTIDCINNKDLRTVAALAIDWMQHTGFYNGLSENFPNDVSRVHEFFESFKRGGVI